MWCAWASLGGGFSCCGAQTRHMDFSSHGTWAHLPCSMWNLPRPGIEPISSALAGRLSTTGPPGGSPHGGDFDSKMKTDWWQGKSLVFRVSLTDGWQSLSSIHPHILICLRTCVYRFKENFIRIAFSLLFMGFSRQEYWSGLLFPSPARVTKNWTRLSNWIELISFGQEKSRSVYTYWQMLVQLGSPFILIVFLHKPMSLVTEV